MQAFVYCWTDHKTNKLYVGSHKGTEDDGYISSSKVMLNLYSERHEDFTRQIIASGKVEDIRKLETVILKSANAAIDETFYNKHNGFGSYLTEDIKKKIGSKSKERYCALSDEDKELFRKRMSIAKKRPKTESERMSMRGKRPHVNQSGSKNNNAKQIKTPYGIFGSIAEGSEKLSMSYDNLHYKLRAKHTGWEYLI